MIRRLREERIATTKAIKLKNLIKKIKDPIENRDKRSDKLRSFDMRFGLKFQGVMCKE